LSDPDIDKNNIVFTKFKEIGCLKIEEIIDNSNYAIDFDENKYQWVKKEHDYGIYEGMEDKETKMNCGIGRHTF